MRSKKVLVTFAALLGVVSLATAQEYPTRAVRLIAPFAPGGATDALARLVSQKLGERWRHQVIVDNRPGAGGNIGAELAVRAAPDGYTLVVAGAPHAINMTLTGNFHTISGRTSSPSTASPVRVEAQQDARSGPTVDRYRKKTSCPRSVVSRNAQRSHLPDDLEMGTAHGREGGEVLRAENENEMG